MAPIPTFDRSNTADPRWLLRREEALASLPEAIDGQPPLPVPSICPVTLDELLSEP